MIPHRHKFIRPRLVDETLAVVCVQRDRDVIILVASDHDHLPVFGEDGAEAGRRRVFFRQGGFRGVAADGGRAAFGAEGAGVAARILFVEGGADDHAGFVVLLPEADALVGFAAKPEVVAVRVGEIRSVVGGRTLVRVIGGRATYCSGAWRVQDARWTVAVSAASLALRYRLGS